MKRTVKAWVVMRSSRTVHYYRSVAYRRKADARNFLGVGERIVPCLVTFDDGKPSRKPAKAIGKEAPRG